MDWMHKNMSHQGTSRISLEGLLSGEYPKHPQRKPTSCTAIRSAAFNSHPKCYVKCGFCDVSFTTYAVFEIFLSNKLALIKSFDFGDFFSLEAWTQIKATVWECIFG